MSEKKHTLIITGTSGMLGSNLVYHLSEKYDIFGIDIGPSNPFLNKQFNIDLTDFEKVKDLIKSVKPKFIIHCAAMTNVDLCEENYLLAREINALATKNITEALSRDARIIYISTDSVFDGKKGNYSEQDLPCPLNNYAKSKLEGEWFVEQLSLNYVIIRTNLFGWNLVKGQSLAEWVINSLSGNSEIKMFTDVIFSPLTVNSLSDYIDILLVNDFVGRINLGTLDSLSKYEFGIKLAKAFGLDARLIEPISIDDFSFKARRPKKTNLNTELAQEILGIAKSIDDEIYKFFNMRKDLLI